ncbi:MAG: cobyrinate a,c-diamide synthase, partial [Candidatus Zixiibacteriota bacterium]
MTAKIPRLVIAGLSGDSGKTIVSLSLIAALRKREMTVSPYKKGPDYIDSAWLGYLAERPCRNLDSFMVENGLIMSNFAQTAIGMDMAVIEGNRGLFDGLDESGQVSTAELAKLLQAPLVLVVNATKTTRTLAVIIKGISDFDNDLNIVGIVINKVAGQRHETIIRNSIEKYCSLPVVGVIPKLGKDADIIPGRHLGLVTPSEFTQKDILTDRLNEIADNYLDIDKLIELAGSAPSIDFAESKSKNIKADKLVKIGYFKDSIFTFYYPENLEALENNGAELVPISSLDNDKLPEIDGLYIGGGFPETQAERLAQNKYLMQSVREKASEGLPIYAECGGLIYLT